MFGRRDKDLDGDFEALRQAHPEVGRLLAAARGPEGVALACDNLFATRRGDAWEVHPWQTLQKGGWDEDTNGLRWTTTQGEQGSIVLDETGRLPEVFNERVLATILVQQQVEVPGGSAIIAGRRPVGRGSDGAEVAWQVVPAGRARLSDPRTQAIVVAKTEQLKADSGLN